MGQVHVDAHTSAYVVRVEGDARLRAAANEETGKYRVRARMVVRGTVGPQIMRERRLEVELRVGWGRVLYVSKKHVGEGQIGGEKLLCWECWTTRERPCVLSRATLHNV